MTQLCGVPVVLTVQRARAGDGATTASASRAARWRVIATLNRRSGPIVKPKSGHRRWRSAGDSRGSVSARRADAHERLVAAEDAAVHGAEGLRSSRAGEHLDAIVVRIRDVD